MMRTMDRATYSAKLIADPDKTDLHDQACRYLLQPEKMEKLAMALYGVSGKWDIRGRLSEPVMGGYQDQNVVGYLDVSLVVSYESKGKDVITGREETRSHYDNAIIEVKGGRSSINSIIQQLETYRRLLPSWYRFFILCTLYPLTAEEKAMLKNHKYRHIYLDPKEVEAFAAKQTPVIEESF